MDTAASGTCPVLMAGTQEGELIKKLSKLCLSIKLSNVVCYLKVNFCLSFVSDLLNFSSKERLMKRADCEHPALFAKINSYSGSSHLRFITDAFPRSCFVLTFFFPLLRPFLWIVSILFFCIFQSMYEDECFDLLSSTIHILSFG